MFEDDDSGTFKVNDDGGGVYSGVDDDDDDEFLHRCGSSRGPVPCGSIYRTI